MAGGSFGPYMINGDPSKERLHRYDLRLDRNRCWLATCALAALELESQSLFRSINMHNLE